MNDTAKTPDSSIRFRKTIGRIYLHEDRLEDAVEIFLGILQDDPNDADVLLDLGNLYLASGDNRTAVSLFRRVIEIVPDKTIIKKQLELALEDESDLPEEPLPTDRKAVSRMLQRLTGRKSPVPEEDIIRAAEMLQNIMSSPNPGDEVAENLDEIGDLLPALIELNIRQARADRHFEIAEGLQNLQINIAFQKFSKDERARKGDELGKTRPNAVLKRRFKGKVLILVPDKNSISDRIDSIYQALRLKGCEVTLAQDFQAEDAHRPDIVIASNPHLNLALSKQMTICAAKGIPVIVDLDMDFENLPIYHPEYDAKGLGRIEFSRAFTASLMLANLITVSSNALADSMRTSGYSVQVMPEGWGHENPFYRKIPTARIGLNIGWVGKPGLLEDLALIRRVLIRVLHEFENSKVIIVGNAEAYQLLDTVPKERKIFMPYWPNDRYLSLLDQIDILTVPLRNHPSNTSLSDRILMEAGVKSIPWIASPIPAFQDWKSGGLIADTREEWHTALRQLIMDDSLRESLGKEGAQAASSREAKNIGAVWISNIEQILGQQNPVHSR